MKYLLYLIAVCLFVSGPVVNHLIHNTDNVLAFLLGMAGGIPAGIVFWKASLQRVT